MKEKPSEITQNYSEIIRILDELKEKGKFLGILFAKRNGELISESVDLDTDCKKFASMCASILESAVGLGGSMGKQKIKKIIAELEEKTVIIVQMIDKKTFLAFILNNQSKVDLIFDRLNPYM